MSDIYGILNTGIGALLTQQKAIDVTGHNIANVNTPGYSRQKVNMETCEPISFASGQIGTGVRAVEIQRIYDRFLGVQINNENQSLGRWETQKDALERAEIVFNESSGYGLNQSMGEFWNAWQDLANNPSGHVERVTLLAKSSAMAASFNEMNSDLQQIQKDIDTSIKGTAGEINLLTEQIAELNEKISQTETGGQNANDYRDSRELLLKDLSLLININTFEDNDGKVNVFTGNGRPLVANLSSWELSTTLNGDNLHDVTWIDNEGNESNITDYISGGKLKGWLDARDVEIPDYLDKLDTLAGKTIEEVNNIHSAGFGLDDSTGNNFFTGTTAADIEVNQVIIDDVNLIAAALSEGAPGDNGNAINIADLQNAFTMSGNKATFDDFYNSLVSEVGSSVQKVTVDFDHQTSVITHLDNYRESISGVSLDEEMVNLIKYQHAYDAAAKLISTVDEMLSTIMNMV